MSKGYHVEQYHGYRVEASRSGRLGGFQGVAHREGFPTLTTARYFGRGAKAAALQRIREIIDGLPPKDGITWGAHPSGPPAGDDEKARPR